ncbi:MAG TPA: Flp pilus assembly protein CpaB [Terriglobales bacterium]|nr:Flp pilus assembly protein CpaB [Terriglobales bacterium]
MNRNRLVLIGILALAAAGVVSVGVYRVLQASVASARTADTTVVVAAFDLPVGSRLGEKDLRTVRMSSRDLPEGYFRTTAELVGRGVIIPVRQNEVLLSSKVASENGGTGLPAAIPPGMRAVAVKVNDVIGVAGFAQPGTRVDVLLTGNPTRDHDPGDVTATTVLQNVQVLSAGQKLQDNGEGKPEKVPVITLLVSPEQAQRLALATQQGKIQLTLRNPLDLEESDVKSLQISTLFQLPSAPAPATRTRVHKAKQEVPPQVQVYSVELIRGAKKDVTVF